MTTQKKRLLRAKVSTALLDELGRQPTEQDVATFTLAARVLYKVVLGVHDERTVQQEEQQLVLC